MRPFGFVLVLLLASALIVACGDGDPFPSFTDGDVPADGDTPDGDSPDGDTPDGDTPDGDTPDGDKPDGDAPDGDDPDGDEPDGDDPDGDDPDGDDPDGDDPDGDDPDGDTPTPSWERLAVLIDDPIVNGTSLMTPIDGLSFAYKPLTGEFVTVFDHDYEDPDIAFLWHLDTATGTHKKKFVTGNPFSASDMFCMGETWCQFISYDPVGEDLLVFGPRTASVMRVDSDYVATRTSVSGTQPPNGAIGYSHLFAWDIDRLLIYGFLTGTGFGSSLYEMTLSTGTWVQSLTGLPSVFDNCLAYDPEEDILYSVGGVVTEDGGDTSEPFGGYTVITRSTSSFASYDLPGELADRQAMSCALDPDGRLLYVFGGMLLNDNWDEQQNEYHNDLWALDLETDTWSLLIPDGPLGTFEANGSDSWFIADPALPNFGKNRGLMAFDAVHSRLILMGDVPRSATQLYFLALPDAAR